MENIVTVIFKVGSQGYQAFSELKRDTFNDDYVISGMALVKKERGQIIAQEAYDAGLRTVDDTTMGGLIGGLIGILGAHRDASGRQHRDSRWRYR